MKKFYSIGCMAAIALAATLTQGCGLVNIDEVTDINTESSIGKGTEVTVITEYTKTLGELVGESSGGKLGLSAEGDYQLSYKLVDNQAIGDGFTFDASQFSLNLKSNFAKEIALTEASIPANTPLSYNPADKAALEQVFTGVNVDFFQSLLSQDYKFDFNIDFTISSFPAQIKVFKSADLGGTIVFNLVPSGIPFTKFTFAKDTEISFPDFFVFTSSGNADFTVTDGHKLVANKDVAVPMGTGISFELALKSLDMGNGVETKGTLPLADKISVNGVISIDPADFNGEKTEINLATDYPQLVALGLISNDDTHKVTVVKSDTSLGSFSVVCNYETKNVTLQNATIQLNKSALPSFQTGDYGFDINGLPEFMSGPDVNIELADVQVNMDVASTLPFAFGLEAKLAALTQGTVNHQYQFGPLNFPANTTTKYSLGTHADGTEGGVIYKQIPDIGKILSPVPTRIEVKDFNVIYDEAQWLTVEAGKTYGGAFSAAVEAPISFTKDTRLSINMDIDDMDLDLKGVAGYLKGETKAVIKLHADNEIPLNFGVGLVVKDSEKKVIDDVKVNIDKDIASGSTGKPTGTDVNITIIIPEGSKMIKSVGFNMKAYGDDAFAGIKLNPNQKISVKNVVFSLPDGATIDLKDVLKK